MARQLDHLLTMSERPNVDLRVLPFGDAPHSASTGTFHLLTAAGATNGSYMACSEDLTGMRYNDVPASVATHTELFDYLHRMALSPSQTAEHIRTTRERYYES